MKGIDVSSHNGNINWEAVKSSGVEVVIIKATEGVDFTDSMVNQHYTGAKSVGLNVGFYHFMSEKTNPVKQAEDFDNCIKDKSYNVMPCLDIEVNNYGRSAAEITDRCLTFLNRFKELSGQDCMIYTGGYFGRDNLDNRIKCYPGWIAHYGVSSPMETGFRIVGHQYTETGRIPGVNGNVDMNNFNESIFLGAPVIANNTTTQPIGGNEYEQHGNAEVLVSALNVRTAPSLNAEIVAQYHKGETIYNYDYVYDRDGYRWIRYVGGSGNYRYVAVRDLSDNHRLCNCY